MLVCPDLRRWLAFLLAAMFSENWDYCKKFLKLHLKFFFRKKTLNSQLSMCPRKFEKRKKKYNNNITFFCLCAFLFVRSVYDTLTCTGNVETLRENFDSRWPEVSFVEPRVVNVSSDGVVLDRSNVAPVSGLGSGFQPKRSRPDFSVRWRDRLTRRLFGNSAAY